MGMTNGILVLFCALQSLILILYFLLNRNKYKIKSEFTFFFIMISVLVMLLSDGAALVWLEPHPAVFSVLETLSFAASYAVVALFTVYAVQVTKPRPSLRRALLRVVGAICVLGAVMYVVNCIRPFFYNPTDQYYFNQFFYLLLQLLLYIAGIFVVTVIWLDGKKKISHRDLLYFTVAPFVPMTSVIIESFVPGLRIRFALIFLVMMIKFIQILFRANEQMQRRIDDEEKNRILTTMERIKPHYIYNVLTSIYYLCDQDVGVAKEAIQIFSDYLRDVMNMMEEETLIPIERELQTVRNYLDLEKMRFGDQVRVRYQLDSRSFMLPPFSVQPLVENSVKHGLSNAGSDGEIIISSFENEDGYYVAIEDTFGGFDPGQTEESGGTGINYIREILAMTVNGTLQIESRPGEGTVSVICIPKKN